MKYEVIKEIFWVVRLVRMSVKYVVESVNAAVVITRVIVVSW